MEIKKESAKKFQRKRRLKYGVNALLFTVGVAGSLVLLFVLTDQAGWQFDFTANRDFSLSSQTEEVLQGLEKPVIIRAFFRPQGDVDQVYIRRKVDDVLRQYAHRSPQVDYQLLNPDLSVETTLQYGIHTDGTIVFQVGDQRKDLYSSQLFNYPSLEEGSLPLFAGESLFTNALLALTQGATQTICFLSGHRERSLEDAGNEGLVRLKQALLRENYQIKTIDLSQNPDWSKLCDLLVVSGPRLGLHRREDQALQAFVASGKKILLMVDPRAEIGLRQTFAMLQVDPASGVVFDPERHFLLGPHYPAPEMTEHPITKKIQTEELTPIFYLARPLEITADSNEETVYAAQEFLKTSAQSWGETQLVSGQEPKRNPNQDRVGPLTVGVAVMREEEPVAVVFGDSDFITNGLYEIPGNADLFLNAVAWLVGSEQQIAIRPQKTDFRPLILTPNQAQRVGWLVQFAYPFLFLAGGLGYWWRRRRRS